LRRIYANLIEGSFTGGNLFLLNQKVITDCAKIIEKFILFRKHPLKMAKILGKRIVIKYLKKYLSIRDLEKIVPLYLKGYTGKAILADPEIALDIDKPIQLEVLKLLLPLRAK
jgi:ABC-type oligopeptide transport system ATPase subunit